MKVFHRSQPIKTHPRQRRGGRFARDPGKDATRAHLRLVNDADAQPVPTGLDGKEVR
jgi:hypothetical protein